MAGEWSTIRDMKGVGGAPTRGNVWCQVEAVRERVTKTGKPFYDLQLRDAEDHASLKVWTDAPGFEATKRMEGGQFLEVDGEWLTGAYGLECRNWQARALSEEEIAELLAGSETLRAKQEQDWQTIDEFVIGMTDPRLRTLCRWFLDEYGDRFRRTAAAREYHHARRGGLVEHVAQMMRSADAVCGVYPQVNRDLVLAGVLFHDSGKLWENCFPEKGFTMPYTERGELLGHIPIGLEFVNRLWRDLMQNEEAESWKTLNPESEQVRLHLLHLIGSHHGEYAFGAPVLPRTPEAMLLHYVDNLDAKLEMMFRGYEVAPELGSKVFERVRPLPARLVQPLDHFRG